MQLCTRVINMSMLLAEVPWSLMNRGEAGEARQRDRSIAMTAAVKEARLHVNAQFYCSIIMLGNVKVLIRPCCHCRSL